MTVSMLTTRLSSVITGCGCERDDLLAQVDHVADAVDERHDDRQPRVERARVAAEALDDAGAGLRHDANRARQRDEHEERDDEGDDESDHGVLLFVDECGRAFDLRDLDACPRLEHLVVHVRACRPFLAADAHAPAVGVDALEHRSAWRR